jgi:hypothetical protein
MAEFDSTVFAFPAAVQHDRASTATLLGLAKERAGDPAIFDTFPPYMWKATISTDRFDSYSTRMKASSLRNYAAEAAAGVAFQDSHKTDGLVRTLGGSLTGSYAGPQGDGVAHTDADFYTVMGMDPTIDSFVNKIRAGLVRDVSIGFYGGQFICSICGRDMLSDWDCWHYPGMQYSVKDDSGKKTDEKVLCTADVEDAHLSEVSAVYDGATPGAVILKAQRDAQEGRIRPDLARQLETRYRIHLPDRTVRGPGIDRQEQPMTDPETTPQDPSKLAVTIRLEDLPAEQVRALFAPAGITADTLTDGIRALTDELARLRPLADDGTAYRADLLAATLAEGVRAFGPGFAKETYEALLKTAPLDTVKRMQADWKDAGDKLFPGGRATVETHPVDGQGDAAPKAGGSEIPDAAYHAR